MTKGADTEQKGIDLKNVVCPKTILFAMTVIMDSNVDQEKSDEKSEIDFCDFLKSDIFTGSFER